MSKSSIVITIYIIGIIFGAIFLDIWSAETTVGKGLAVMTWTALFIIIYLFVDEKK